MKTADSEIIAKANIGGAVSGATIRTLEPFLAPAHRAQLHRLMLGGAAVLMLAKVFSYQPGTTIERVAFQSLESFFIAYASTPALLPVT